MSTETKSSLKEKLATLKKERARITNEIAKLVDHSTKNEKKAGYVRYMHSEHVKVEKGQHEPPRITLAAYVDHSKKELYYGLKVWNKGFNRKVSRHKALGKALSIKYRKTVRLAMTDNQSIHDKMEDILAKAELTAFQNHLKKNIATPQIRVRVTELVTESLSQNGTH